MSLSEPVATVLAALVATPPGIWLALKTKNAKRDALEKLVAAAVKTSEQNHRDEIARTNKQHREQVEWLQGQILYYQQLSQPAKFHQPIQPPDQP